MQTGYKCCFTGHRDIDARHAECLATVLDNVIEQLISCGVTCFRAGGALGFDTIAALKVLEKKSEHPDISLDLYLPCRDQTARWGDYDREIYSYVLDNANSITYTSEQYHRGCMLLRNRKMADGVDFCVSYCQKNSGGTAYTVEYAKGKGVKIINVASLCDKKVADA